ncbi:peptidase M24, partial [Agromyces sp. MMS17-SY077]|nr:peptidase M24 [Agromyces seonyuensis]
MSVVLEPAGELAGQAVDAVSRPDAADRAVKRERVRALLAERGARGVVLRSHGALAWYLDGVRTHVSLAGDPVLAVIVTLDDERLRVAANEADRLIAEELHPEDAARLERVPWHEPLAPPADGLVEEADLGGGLRAARASLLPAELARYRALGREAAEVLTDVAHGVRPDDA